MLKPFKVKNKVINYDKVKSTYFDKFKIKIEILLMLTLPRSSDFKKRIISTYELINKFNKITNIPMLINTSNINGEPIVEVLKMCRAKPQTRLLCEN